MLSKESMSGKIMLRNIGVWVVGICLGSALNGLIVNGGGRVIPLPGGGKTLDDLVAAAPFMMPEHFLFPWLAHALGTVFASFVITWGVKARQPLHWGISAGVLFLSGGIWMASQVPAPGWFLVADLGVAYLPMAGLGAYWAQILRRQSGNSQALGE